MPKYHVHVYPVVRVLVSEVEAQSPEEACRQAERAVDVAWALKGTVVEYANDIDGFLVDMDGDTEHQLSAWYDAEYHPL